MGDGPLLDRRSIDQLLHEVSDELATEGVRGRMFVVGGAAVALAFGRERTTQDVDAVFEPKDVVYAAARRVAGRHRLADDWLDDGVAWSPARSVAAPGEVAKVTLEGQGSSGRTSSFHHRWKASVRWGPTCTTETRS